MVFFLAAVDGYLIEDCTIRNCGLSGILIYGTEEDWPPITNGIIRGNEIVDMDPVHGDGITLHKSDGDNQGDIGPNHLLENNRIGNCGENAYDLTAGSYITVRNCEGYGSRQIEVSIGHNATDIWIDRCYFHDGERSGISVGPSARVKISNTIVENMAYHSLIVGDTSGNERPVTNVKLYNNSIYHTSSASVFDVSKGVNDLQFKNNIVMETESPRFLRYLGNASPSETNSDFTNNIWWRSNQSIERFAYDDSDAKTFDFSYWQDHYGQGSNSLFAEPDCIDAAGGDYHLQEESAGIDTGFNVGIVDDFEGNSRPQGKQVDIGAFEYLQQKKKSSMFFTASRGT